MPTRCGRELLLAAKTVASGLISDPIKRKRAHVLAHNFLSARYRINGVYDSSAPLLDYKNVIRRKYYPHDELYYNNTFYGTELVLRKYARCDLPVKACIEHGIYFGISGVPEEYDGAFPGLITFGKERVSRIKEVSDITVYPIGPYIHYADFYHQDSLNQIKEELGKTLLVYPAHSIEYIESEYSVEHFIDKVNCIAEKNNFDSIIVSIYPNDIMRGKHRRYAEEGFHVFTAGNRDDPWFLNRQKSILYIADAVITNSIGTHIGYAVYLNRPVSYYEQEIARSALVEKDTARLTTTGNTRAQTDVATAKKLFNGWHETINETQRSFCNQFWGFDSLKTSAQLAELFNELNEECKKARILR